MNNTALPPSERERPRDEFRSYVKGIVLAAILTAAAFAIVGWRLLPREWALISLGALALVQIVVHFRFFLHIDLDKSHRDDLQLVLFTGLVVFLMVAGSVWILWSQHARMAPPETHATAENDP